MKKKISETPEKWVVLEFPNDSYKIFGTWSGGYLGSDRWKLNSGIENVEQDDDFYYFMGYSGSCYKCNRKEYGIATSYGLAILNNILQNKKITLMEDIDNWENVIKN